MEIHPVGAELFHADEQPDGQTDMTKIIVTFHNFATPKNVTECFMIYSLSSILPLGIEQDINFKLPTGLYPQRITSLVPHTQNWNLHFYCIVHKLLLNLAEFQYTCQSNIPNCQCQFLTYNIHCGWKEFQKLQVTKLIFVYKYNLE